MPKVTDKNGKEFEFEVKDIEDMDVDYHGTGPTSLHDSESHPMTNFTPTILDADNNALDINKLVKDINDGKTKVPGAIDVLFEATHTGDNLNSFIYHGDSMTNDVATWMTPFPKPFIKNHDMYEEPLGRVKDAWFEQSDFNPDRECCNVIYRITDQDATMKFLDGRYKTMSVGGKMGTVTCGICGKSILKDGQFKFCGHWRGEVYNGQLCKWNGRDITYKEGSAVNAPADVWAQVKRITVVGDAKLPPKQPEGKDDENMPKDAATIVDGLTDDGKGADKNTPPNPDNKPDDQKDDENKDNGEETVESLKVKLEDAQKEIKTLKDTIVEKDVEIKTFKDSNIDLTSKLELADKDKTDIREQLITVAVSNKKLMAQRVTDYAVFNKEIKDTEVEEKISVLTIKKAKELQDMCEALKVNVQADGNKGNPNPVDPKHAPNPGAASDQEQNSEFTDEEDKNKENKETNKGQKTFADLEAVMLKALGSK